MKLKGGSFLSLGRRKAPPGVEGKSPERDEEAGSKAREREQDLSLAPPLRFTTLGLSPWEMLIQ